MSTTDYVVTDDGWIAGIYYPNNNVNDVFLSINGVNIAHGNNSSTYGSRGTTVAKVSKGDVVKVSDNRITQQIYFVPHK